MISYEQYLQFSPYFAQEDIEKEEDRLKFFESFDALPQTVKNLIASTDTAEKIMAIGKNFRLDEFDTEALSLVVRKLATGEVSIIQGAELVINGTGLPEEKANDLLNSIIGNILTPVIGGFKQTPKVPSPKIPEKLDLKVDPEVNKNNVVDLRNR